MLTVLMIFDALVALTLIASVLAQSPKSAGMVGERSHQSYRLGDTVEVVLVRASVEERNIDFILKDNGVYVPQTARKGGSGKSGGRNGRPGAKPEAKGNQAAGRSAAGQRGKTGASSTEKTPAKKHGAGGCADRLLVHRARCTRLAQVEEE